MGNTLSESIQCLFFAEKWFNSVFDSILFIQNSIQTIIQLKKYADSIQKKIQFNSKGIIDTGPIGKVPKNCLKSVQNRLKRGLFIKNGKYQFKI